MSDAFLRELKDGLLTLTLNRSDKLNALNFACFKGLAEAIDFALANQDKVGCVLLRGAGRSFCAGNDLSDLGGVFNDGDNSKFRSDTVERLASLPMPVVAIVQGHCLTGGLELALQRVRGRTDLLLGGRVELGQAPEDLGERASFTSQDLRLEIGQPALVRLRNFLQTLPQLGEGCQEVAHDQSACLATSAICSNATGSRTARSARTLRLISTPALRSPFMRRL